MAGQEQQIINGLLATPSGKKLYDTNRERFFQLVRDQSARTPANDILERGSTTVDMLKGFGKRTLRTVGELGSYLDRTDSSAELRDNPALQETNTAQRIGGIGSDLAATAAASAVGGGLAQGARLAPAAMEYGPGVMGAITRFLATKGPTLLGEGAGEFASGLVQGSREGGLSAEDVRNSAEGAALGTVMSGGMRAAGDALAGVASRGAQKSFRKFSTGSATPANPVPADMMANEIINEGVPLSRANLRARLDAKVGKTGAEVDTQLARIGQQGELPIGPLQAEVGTLRQPFQSGRDYVLNTQFGQFPMSEPATFDFIGETMKTSGFSNQQIADTTLAFTEAKLAGKTDEALQILRNVGFDIGEVPVNLQAGRATSGNRTLDKLDHDIGVLASAGSADPNSAPVGELLKLRNNISHNIKGVDFQNPSIAIESLDTAGLEEQMVKAIDEVLQADIPGQQRLRELFQRISVLEELDRQVARAGARGGGGASSIGAFASTAALGRGEVGKAIMAPLVLDKIQRIISSPIWSALKARAKNRISRTILFGTSDQVQRVLSSSVAEAMNPSPEAEDYSPGDTIPPDLLGVVGAVTRSKDRRQ